MRTYLFYLEFALYMIGCSFKRAKYNKLKKKSEEEAQKYLETCVKGWAQFIIDKIHLNVEISGLDNIPKEACLFVSNHQSFLDIPVLLANLPGMVGFVAKKELANSPMITFWMEQIGCVFINRENPREGIKAILKGVENLKNGKSMLIFPEGTRSKSEQMNEFKKGSLKMAQKSGAPIVPITLDGTYKSYEGNNNKIKSDTIKIKIHKPIDIKNLNKEDKDLIHTKIQEIIKNGF